MKEKILSTPFMVALAEERYEDVHEHFGGLKDTLNSFMECAELAWCQIHHELIYIEDEIHSFLCAVPESINSLLLRASQLISKFIGHAQLMMKLPTPKTSQLFKEEADDKFLRCLAKKGKLKKIDVVMLGHAIHEKAFKDDTEVTVVEICVGLGKYFGMEITEGYVRSAFTDIRNQYQSDNKLFIETLCEVFIGKIHRAIEKSNKLYDKKLREEKLKARK